MKAIEPFYSLTRMLICKVRKHLPAKEEEGDARGRAAPTGQVCYVVNNNYINNYFENNHIENNNQSFKISNNKMSNYYFNGEIVNPTFIDGNATVNINSERKAETFEIIEEETAATCGQTDVEQADAPPVDEPPIYAPSASPFDSRVDANKVAATFHEFMKTCEGSLLNSKSFWIVVCVLFEFNGWLSLRMRAEFRSWANANHFLVDELTESDFKGAKKNIVSGETDLTKWPDNKYRDLAYAVKELFFGERQGLPNGYFTYAKEQFYLKPGTQIRHKSR